MLNKIQRFNQNFMPYKMIYHLPHNFKIKIYVETTNKAHNFNLLIELVLMICIYITFIE